MKILNEYATHHYWDEYRIGQLFCPNCGKQSVWEEQGSGDYYCGPDYLCISCDHRFSIQGPDKPEWGNVTKKLEQLKSGVTLKPSTPEGH